MKIAITGGHISPAMAVIEALPKDSQVVFIGRKYAFEGDASVSFEYQEITAHHIPFYTLKTGRLQRALSRHTLSSLFRIPKGVWDAYTILKKEKPDRILSFGGYIGLPVVIAGFLLGIPRVIHEQTFHAGLSNRIASQFVQKICVSWEESQQYFPKDKTVLTGNPLRNAFLEISDKKPKQYEKPLIYVTGGSAGSHEVNELVKRYLDSLLDKYTIIHQTGDTDQYKDFDTLVKKRETLSIEKRSRYHLYKFTSPDQAAAFIRDSSLVVSRSGVNTITELLYVKKKAYVIPLIHGQKGEQMTNAMFLKKRGLAEIHKNADTFLTTVQNMIHSDMYSLSDSFDSEKIKNASSHIVSILTDGSKKS